MAEVLKSLIYASNKSTNPEELTQANQSLYEFIHTPESIGAAFEIYEEQTNSENTALFRQVIALTLKSILKYNIEFLQQTGFDEVKQRLLAMLINTTDINLTKHLSRAIEPIMTSIPTNCGEFFELAANLINTQTPDCVSRGLYICIPLLACVPEENAAEFYAHILPLIQGCFSTNNENILEPAAHILYLCFAFCPELDSELKQPLLNLIEVFSQIIHTESNLVARIADELESIFMTEYPFEEMGEYYTIFLGIANDETLSVNMRQHPIKLASVLLSQDQSIREMAGDFLNVVINFGVSSIDENLLDDQEYLTIFAEPIQILCKTCSKAQLLDTILNAIASAENLTEPYLIIYATALTEICAEGYEVVSNKVLPILNFAVEMLQFQGENAVVTVCVIEAAFELLTEMFHHVNRNYDSAQSTVFGLIATYVQEEEIPSLQIRSVACLDTLFGATTLNPEFIQQSVELLAALTATSNKCLLQTVIEAFGSLIFSAGSQILPFAQQILEILSTAAALDNVEDIPIKAEAISSIANLVRYIDEKDQFIQLFVENVQSQDTSLVLSAFDAFSTAIPHLDGYAEQVNVAFQVSIGVLNTEFEYKDSVDEEDENTLINRYVFAALLLCKRVTNYYGYLVEPVYEQLNSAITRILEKSQNNDSVLTKAVSLGNALHSIIGKDLPDFYAEVLPIALDSREIFCKLLSSISNAIHDQIDVTAVLEATTDAALQGMKHELSFQEDEDISNYDSLIGEALSNYFSAIGTVLPQLFPHYQYYQNLQSILEEANNYEKIDYIFALSSFFCSAHEQLELLIKKKIMELIANSLELNVEYEFPVQNITAIRRAVEFEPQGMAKFAPKLLELLHQILTGEDNGEMFYADTQAAAVSLLLVIQNQICGPNFDAQTFLPLIWKLFPVISDGESDKAYSYLTGNCGDYPQLYGPYGTDIAIALGKTLALDDSYFMLLNLSEETFISVCTLFNNLAALNAKIPPLVEQAVADVPGGMDNINMRLQQAADEVGPVM